MSAWDDSWGYASARPLDVVVSGKIGDESGTGRCVNTDPLLTTVTRAIEEVAEMTSAYLHVPYQSRVQSVTSAQQQCPFCGWQRWEHAVRPEWCDWFTGGAA